MRSIMLAIICLGLAARPLVAQVNLPPLPPVSQPNLPPAPNVASVSAPAFQGPGGLTQNSQFPAEMTIITQNGVEARSGPTNDFYPTNKLRFGERVIVLRDVKEQPGWYAIKPPTGSFSWVNGKYLKVVDPRIGYVEAEGNTPVPILSGSSVVNKEPNVEIAKIPSGSLVTIMDRPMEASGQKWFMIAPTPTEVRFIPKDAVMPPQTASVTPPNWTRAPGTSIPVFGQNTWNTPGQVTSGTATQPVGTPASFSQPASQWTQHNGVATQPPQWSQWGKLRRTAFEKDGQPMYVLEDRTGQPLMYVTTNSGTSLKNYVEQNVCLYGVISYRSDGYQRTHYMVASHVATP